MSSSSSSSSCGTAACLRYIHSSHFTGKERGTAYVYVRHIKGWSAAHHFIVVDIPGKDKWAIYEWLDTGLEKFATEKFRGLRCLRLGEFSLDEVNSAADEAAKGRLYSVTDFNCNIWTDRVASLLGVTIRVYYNCSEVTYTDRRVCHFGSKASVPLLAIVPLIPALGVMGIGRFVVDKCVGLVPINEKC